MANLSLQPTVIPLAGCRRLSSGVSHPGKIMEDSDNIEFFNLFTVALLDRLYASFPTPININARDLVSNLLADEPDDDAWLKKSQAAEHAASFLSDEGFITYGDARIKSGLFQQVRLTGKGLAVLNATPGSIERSEPLINKVRATVAKGAKEAGKKAIRQIVQAILVAGIKAASS